MIMSNLRMSDAIKSPILSNKRKKPMRMRISAVKRRYRRGLKRYSKKTFSIFSPRKFIYHVRYRQTVWKNASPIWKIGVISFLLVLLMIDVFDFSIDFLIIIVLLGVFLVLSISEIWYAGGKKM